MIKIKIKNLRKLQNTVKEFPHFLDTELSKNLGKAALLVERESKIETPVLTGRLRSSIRTKLHPKKAIISPHTNYAFFVHEGMGSNKRKGRRPFMEQGLKTAEPEIQRLLGNLSKTIERRFAR